VQPSRHNVLPTGRGLRGLPLPLLPTCRGPMPILRQERPRHRDTNNLRGLRLLPSRGSGGGVLVKARLLRLWILQQSVKQGIPMKSLVLSSTLSVEPATSTYPLRLERLGLLSLLLQSLSAFCSHCGRSAPMQRATVRFDMRTVWTEGPLFPGHLVSS